MKKAIILVGFILASRCAFAILAHIAAAPVYVVTVCAAKCCIEENPPQGSVRADMRLGWAAREGLACSSLARVASS